MVGFKLKRYNLNQLQKFNYCHGNIHRSNGENMGQHLLGEYNKPKYLRNQDIYQKHYLIVFKESFSKEIKRFCNF